MKPNMGNTSGLQQFLMLLYKGLLLRKRHYVITAFETIVPILVASIPVIIVSELARNSPHPDASHVQSSSLGKNATFYSPVDPYSIKSVRKQDKINFIYAPDTTIAGTFMEDAIKMWKDRTGYDGNTSKNGFDTEDKLETYAVYNQRQTDGLIIGTVLNNFKDIQLSNSLDFKIRYGNDHGMTTFYTNIKYRIDGPQTINAYTETYFLSWQAAIEETFIRKKVNQRKENLDFQVLMQRFPYPEHQDSGMSFSLINILPWLICYGLIIFATNLIKRVTEEKSNGSKELLKMMGMTDCVYWISTFMNYFAFGAFVMLMISIIYKVPFQPSSTLLKETDFVLLLVLLLLFMADLILFCLSISTFFTRPVFATIVTLMIFSVSLSLLATTYFMPDTRINYIMLNQGGKLGMCLLPTGALLTMFQVISSYESIGEGAQWSNITKYDAIPDLNLLMVIGMTVLSCLIYSIIIWYIDAVWPWQYGVPKPFYFLFTKSYWFGHQSDNVIQGLGSINQSEFFEDEPSGTTPGVVIQNLSKVFRTGLHTKLAVNNVSLNIYNGQITALLGHNGAGKTTTINILTGLFTPTSGSASINGWDICMQTKKARQSLGVCPQHNVLYDTLTVDEHLKIYAGLKGVRWSNLADESMKILKILHLEDKKNELTKNLSGGMKRKLSLGIAIIGGSKVLFLDEPTSGMDPEARRSVWDALLDIRNDCTIVLTTHYMEEADILGDRIAIMADGEVQCCGSPMFLKRKFGTGYQLHIVKDSHFNLSAVTTLLQTHIPGVTMEKHLEREITFNLSSNLSTSFGQLFGDLESNKNELGISSCGVSITTMEDVFLNVANIAELKLKKEGSDGDLKHGYLLNMEDDVFLQQQQLSDSSLLALNQLFGLLVKRLHYSKRHWGILIAQIIIPFLILCLCLYTMRNSSGSNTVVDSPLKLNLADVYGDTKGFYLGNGSSEAELFAENYLKKVLEENHVSLATPKDPQEYILAFADKDLPGYLKTLLVGGIAETNHSKSLLLLAWYNGEPGHVMPMSLNIMHTAVLQSISGSQTGTISVTNAPLPYVDEYIYDDQSRYMERTFATVYIPLALSFLSASFVLVPIQERTSRAKLLQLMTGLPSPLYWCAMFLWDVLIHIIVCIVMLIPFAIFNSHVFFAHSEAIGTAFLLFLMFGWCSIPFCYLMSFLFQKPTTGFQVTVTISVITGLVCSSIMNAVVIALRGSFSSKIDTIMWILRIFPSFSVSIGFSNLFAIAFSNAFCDGIPEQTLQFVCNSSITESTNSLFQCCKGICGTSCKNQTYPLTWDAAGCGRDIFFMAFDGILFFSLLLFFETTIPKTFWRFLKQQIKTAFYKIRPHSMEMLSNEQFEEDSEVLSETQRIENLCETSMRSNEALIALNLTKMYKNLCAVDHLTFGVHQKECFGLLGINGAGKTTTFKMLTGDILPTSGNAFIQDSNLIKNQKKFQSYIGYCPQYDALIDRLTGREMLILFARLRGLARNNMEPAVNQLIRMVDLEEHADKKTMLYSGGNKRKLSLALALIGTPPLILLDEPTSGVDPVSRRKIWNILSQARNNTGAAIILTTHSMEESEALCSRLAIMVNGKFRCLGSIQELKTKYGKGYTVIIKLKKEALADPEALNITKRYFESNLPGAELKDDHQGVLQYHMTDVSTTLSHLFNFMDDMKPKFNLEDYLISDNSLEQIFLAFARAQRVSSEEHK